MGTILLAPTPVLDYKPVSPGMPCGKPVSHSVTLLFFLFLFFLYLFGVHAGSSSCGGDVAIYVFDIDQPSLPTPLYSVLVSISVFMALSTAFHSTKSSDNSRLSHSGLPVLFLPYWSFQLHISL